MQTQKTITPPGLSLLDDFSGDLSAWTITSGSPSISAGRLQIPEDGVPTISALHRTYGATPGDYQGTWEFEVTLDSWDTSVGRDNEFAVNASTSGINHIYTFRLSWFGGDDLRVQLYSGRVFGGFIGQVSVSLASWIGSTHVIRIVFDDTVFPPTPQGSLYVDGVFQVGSAITYPGFPNATNTPGNFMRIFSSVGLSFDNIKWSPLVIHP